MGQGICTFRMNRAAPLAPASKGCGAWGMQPNLLFAVGIVIGLAVGVLFGFSIGNVTLGMPTGVMLGLLIGLIMSKSGSDQT